MNSPSNIKRTCLGELQNVNLIQAYHIQLHQNLVRNPDSTIIVHAIPKISDLPQTNNKNNSSPLSSAGLSRLLSGRIIGPDDGGVPLALLNDVILDTIFDGLSTKDLKACRLVCSKWNTAGTFALSKRRVCIRNEFVFRSIDNVGERHIVGEFNERRANENEEFRPQFPNPGIVSQPPRLNRVESVLTLGFSSLTSIIEASHRFPCQGILLTNHFWRLNHSAVKRFLKFYGAEIKFLKINYNFQTIKPLLELLAVSLPNLEEIAVEYVGNFARAGILSRPYLSVGGSGIILPKLKKIAFRDLPKSKITGFHSTIICEELIAAATNLEKIINFNPNLTAAVVRAGKVHTISKLTVSPFTTAEQLKEFARAAPTLRRLELDRIDDLMLNLQGGLGLSDALLGILECSKDSLLSLKVIPACLLPFKNSTRLKFPTLRKLSTLEIIIPDHSIAVCLRRSGLLLPGSRLNFFGVFPENALMSEVVPNLEKIRLVLSTVRDRTYFLQCLGTYDNDSVPSVSTLEYSCIYDTKAMSTLSKFFPNITRLVINWPVCFSLGDHNLLWTMPFPLKSLELCSVSFIWDKGPHSGNAMDSFFTGIPESICKNIRQTGNFFTDLEVLKTGPAIADMKHLTDLKIRFSYDGLLGLRLLGRCPLISPVTGVYGFSRLPDLKVSLLFDFHRPMAPEMIAALQPISPYVSFLHSEDHRF